MMTTERKLDIFQALAAVDRRDSGWFEKQPEDAKKEFSPPVFLRWVSSISDEKQASNTILAANEFININMWDYASEHPEMVFRLAALCGTGSKQRHEWVAMPGRSMVNNKAKELIARFNLYANDTEIEMLLRSHTRQTFLTFIDDTAIPSDEAKETIKAYDKFIGGGKSEPKPKTKRK